MKAVILSTQNPYISMFSLTPDQLRIKARRLRLLCLLLWLMATLAPVFLAGRGFQLGPWPLDFWMAAQGSLLSYLMIVVVYAGLVNRWERQAGALSFSIAPVQDA